MFENVAALFDSFFGAQQTLAPQYLFVWFVIAWALFLWRRETGSFTTWLMPRAIWAHKSTALDIKLLVIGRLMSFFGILSKFLAAPLIAAFVANQLPGAALGHAPLSPVLLAFLFWVSGEFAYYWSHRAHHSIKTIWPLHAVHHSAEVLTPLTTYRQHPLGLLVSTSFQSVVIGIIMGVLVGVFDNNASLAKIAGANAFIVLSNATVANFHHMHIWVSFGPVLERFVISPAQHQVHHSTDPAHYNKNFGNVLAIWDWMFGTLHVTGACENITFGLNAKADAPLMTHRLASVLWNPVSRLLSLPEKRP